MDQASSAARRRLPSIIQVALVIGMIPALPFVPPAQGRMLVFPTTPASASRLPHTVLDHGGLLLGAGPVAGSLIVIGSRAALAGPLLGIGALAVATDGGGCTIPEAA